MTAAEIDRFSGAGHRMQRYLRDRYISDGQLWFLTTEKGVSRETVAKIQKRIHRLQHERDFYAYSAWCFETRPKLHAHFLFVGDTAVVDRLRRGAFAEIIQIKPVYDLPGLVMGYQAKERTPQAGFGRKRQLGGRFTGSHRLEGGGDRVRLSRELELDAIEQALVEPAVAAHEREAESRSQRIPKTAADRSRAPPRWSDPAFPEYEAGG